MLSVAPLHFHMRLKHANADRAASFETVALQHFSYAGERWRHGSIFCHSALQLYTWRGGAGHAIFSLLGNDGCLRTSGAHLQPMP